jgi:glutamate N-acetyltransferase/amino-acid N-acetyltransferase
VTTGFDLAPGFRAAATACGLKPSGRPDLTLIVADEACSAAGVFTANRVKAAPVLYDQRVLARNAGVIRAILANAGCANACTGEDGERDAAAMAALAAGVAGCMPDQVLVLSTGVIGVRLDLGKIERGVTALAAELEVAAGSGGAAAASAILTTDTRPKMATTEAIVAGRRVVLNGFAKGAGMIHPNMATMLAVITTDARIDPGRLHDALVVATRRSFNRISVDGDMSTNDTVLVLASGVSGVAIDGAAMPRFVDALTQVCASLAQQIARDGEGATRLVEIRVTGSPDEDHAHAVGNRIACSPLVKTAIHGGDPNWGRILAAAGDAGVEVDPARMSLAVGAEGSAVLLAANGMRAHYEERTAASRLREDPVYLKLDLGMGGAEATVWTCDLSEEYVAINAEYTT